MIQMRAAHSLAPKRRSNVRFQDEKETTAKKARLSSKRDQTPDTDEYDPEEMISNLDQTISRCLAEENLPEAVALELKGFDATVASVEEYREKREQIRHLLKDSEFFDKKTELNLEEAAIASAKLEVDRRVTTRRMSKKYEACGIQENDILYKGLDIRLREKIASKELRDSRQASIVESCVDFQKQIQWKMNIMEHVKAKSEENKDDKIFPKTDGPSVRTRGGQDRHREELKKIQNELVKKSKQIRKKPGKSDADPFKTPQKKLVFNALDERRIIENYALEVASEVREHSENSRRQIAPVPFNINILDSDEEDDEVERMDTD